MMARGKAEGNKRAIAAYDHADKQRVNNPPAGLVTLSVEGLCR